MAEYKSRVVMALRDIGDQVCREGYLRIWFAIQRAHCFYICGKSSDVSVYVARVALRTVESLRRLYNLLTVLPLKH